MKSTICKLIMQAPKVYVSSNSNEMINAEHLVKEAMYLNDLLRVLMYHYNSAVEPQATMYRRISRLQDRASQRHRRRMIKENVVHHSVTGWTPLPDHIWYSEIMEGIRAYDAREKAKIEEIGV